MFKLLMHSNFLLNFLCFILRGLRPENMLPHYLSSKFLASSYRLNRSTCTKWQASILLAQYHSYGIFHLTCKMLMQVTIFVFFFITIRLKYIYTLSSFSSRVWVVVLRSPKVSQSRVKISRLAVLRTTAILRLTMKALQSQTTIPR